MRKAILLVGGGIILVILMAVPLYFTPFVQRRVASLRTEIHYRLNPPDQVALVPEHLVAEAVQGTLAALAQTATPSPSPTASLTPEHTPTTLIEFTATPTFTPTATPTALPPVVKLTGIRHEWQSFNNCGPANVAMALSFWGWQGNQTVTKAALRPHPDDANVMPEEMAAYIESQTELRALVRTGGSIDLLKRLVAAGFPALIEMGHHPSDDWWMGHYVVVSGYDDHYAALITQDSLIVPDMPQPYDKLETRWWRDFNHLYLVIYPPERETELLSILGPDADALENARRTLATADAEIPHLSGRDLFFALFNRGSGLLTLDQPQAAAEAFDIAFAVYSALEEKQRPWRILWYRTEAYQAYYEAGRYQSTVDLTTAALSMLSKRGLEESHYWRGLAYAALGQRDLALRDLQQAVILRPGYREAEEALSKLERGE
jgi:tetratricopeptide (TPR) repeat protein